MELTFIQAALIYASELTLLSIGFTLTYLTAKIPNFAHGTYAGIGIYVAYTFVKVFGLSPYYGFPFAFLLGGVISVVVYIFIIGTLMKMGSGSIVLTIATLAIQIFLTALINIFAYWVMLEYHQYAQGFLLKENDFQFAGWPGIFIVAISISIVTVIILHFALTKTKIGIAMRATAEDPELSSVLGININRIQLFSWFITGGLACLAGAMIPLWFQSGTATGSSIITSIMAGSLLGGFESVYGAILGGFTVGISEIVLTYLGQLYIGTWVGEYRTLIPMAFLVIVLLIEPRGFQGFYDRYMASRVKVKPTIQEETKKVD
jgi:branched-chain amino acid transport system permease protein